jgi:hypothetical protein
MITYEVTLNCDHEPHCGNMVASDLEGTPERAEASAKQKAEKRGWKWSSDGDSYCPEHARDAK